MTIPDTHIFIVDFLYWLTPSRSLIMLLISERIHRRNLKVSFWLRSQVFKQLVHEYLKDGKQSSKKLCYPIDSAKTDQWILLNDLLVDIPRKIRGRWKMRIKGCGCCFITNLSEPQRNIFNNKLGWYSAHYYLSTKVASDVWIYISSVVMNILLFIIFFS